MSELRENTRFLFGFSRETARSSCVCLVVALSLVSCKGTTKAPKVSAQSGLICESGGVTVTIVDPDWSCLLIDNTSPSSGVGFSRVGGKGLTCLTVSSSRRLDAKNDGQWPKSDQQWVDKVKNVLTGKVTKEEWRNVTAFFVEGPLASNTEYTKRAGIFVTGQTYAPFTEISKKGDKKDHEVMSRIRDTIVCKGTTEARTVSAQSGLICESGGVTVTIVDPDWSCLLLDKTSGSSGIAIRSVFDDRPTYLAVASSIRLDAKKDGQPQSDEQWVGELKKTHTGKVTTEEWRNVTAFFVEGPLASNREYTKREGVLVTGQAYAQFLEIYKKGDKKEQEVMSRIRDTITIR